MCLSKVQGSKGVKRASRTSGTMSKLRTQLTQQFAKSIGGASGIVRRQADAAHVSEGFTVVELMVGITIGSILFLAFMAALTNQFVLITKNNASIDMAANSQNLLRTTVEALRVGDGVRQTNIIADANAPSGGWNTSNADFVIVIASPALNSARNYIIDPNTGGPYMNELVYYKSVDSLMERRLANPSASGNSLVTSCPPSSSSQSCPPDKLLADYVQSMTFTLYDQDNNLTTDPTLARLIQIDLGLRRTVFGSAISINNSIWVTLRNRF